MICRVALLGAEEPGSATASPRLKEGQVDAKLSPRDPDTDQAMRGNQGANTQTATRMQPRVKSRRHGA